MAAFVQNPAFATFAPAGPAPKVLLPPESVEHTSDVQAEVIANDFRPVGVLQNFGLFAGVAGAALLVAQRGTARHSQQKGVRIAQTGTTRRAFDSELGVTLPLKYWDPMGLASDDDEVAFRRRRIAEIKNGRVAMIACMGYIAPEYFRWPGYCSPSLGLKFTDIPNGVAALTKIPAEGWGQIGVFIAFLELFPLRQEPDRIPGDAPGCGKLGIPWFFVAGKPGTVCDAAASERSLNAEINNGRLAMVAITGMVVQNGFLGTTGPEMWLPSSAQDSALGAFEGELGATLPFKYWDPMGLASDGDADAFRRRRTAEIKNGRVAMIACMGYIAPEYFRWPGYLSPSAGIKFTDLPNGVAALSKMPAEGWGQIGVFIAFLELFPLRQEPDRIPGDAPGCGKLGIPWFFVAGRPGTVCDPVGSERSLNAELNNGRLAMVAITGMVMQNGFIGTTGPEMWVPSSAQAPLRAFEDELGVQPPTGFWDPAGFTSDGDQFDFYRRRCVEIKHGRVSMLACIGYIVPEYFKFPGYLSPSIGLKFADIPNGLAALTKVPAIGWQQIVFFGLAMELFAAYQNPKLPPGKLSSRLVVGLTEIKDWPNNYEFGPYGIPNAPSIADPEVRKKKLNAEIANGRLAMIAIMGMLFQNGTVGTTGPEMWLPQS